MTSVDPSITIFLSILSAPSKIHATGSIQYQIDALVDYWCCYYYTLLLMVIIILCYIYYYDYTWGFDSVPTPYSIASNITILQWYNNNNNNFSTSWLMFHLICYPIKLTLCCLLHRSSLASSLILWHINNNDFFSRLCCWW